MVAAVFLDGVILGSISSDGGNFQEDKFQAIFVEMKTRQAEDTTIREALASREKNGSKVF